MIPKKIKAIHKNIFFKKSGNYFQWKIQKIIYNIYGDFNKIYFSLNLIYTIGSYTKMLQDFLIIIKKIQKLPLFHLTEHNFHIIEGFYLEKKS